MNAPSPEQEFVRIASEDTGFLARHVLGYNYDEDPDTNEKVNIGTGGIRDEGPHKLMVDFLDDRSFLKKHLEAPRGSYKSTLLNAYMARRILADRNIRILYGMHTASKVSEKVMALRNQLEHNELIQRFWGKLRGSHWESTKFTVAGRTDHGLQEPTLSTFAVDKPQVGGHYDVIILDDLVDSKNSRTKEGIEKVIKVFQMTAPLQANGCTFIVVGTRYADADMYQYILDRNRDPDDHREFKHLILDAGVDVVSDESGKFALDGKPLFPHLTLNRLTGELRQMDYDMFCSQYLNKVVAGINEPFRREQLRPCNLTSKEMAKLSGFLLTDTAYSQKEEGCYSVLAYVGLDENYDAYVLDLDVGHFTPNMFENKFLDMLERWGPRVNHIKEVMEKTHANEVHMDSMRRKSKERRIRTSIQVVTRGGADQAKERRIMRLQPRLSSGQFFVNSTVPKTFVDLTETKKLYDPAGFHDADSGLNLPDGELVMEFIRFPRYAKNDIVDALADIDGVDKDGMRFCSWRRPLPRRDRDPQPGQVFKFGPQGLEADNRLRRSNDPMKRDWWDDLNRRNFG